MRKIAFMSNGTGQHRVVFEQNGDTITIGRWWRNGDHDPLMVLTVGLDDDGECVLSDADNKQWRLWQVRMKALDTTLFSST